MHSWASYKNRKSFIHDYKFIHYMRYVCMQTFNEFEVEFHADCTYDKVEFYDGPNPTFPKLARVCGSKPAHPILASSNVLFMTFSSDASVQRKGFDGRHDTGAKCFSSFHDLLLKE